MPCRIFSVRSLISRAIVICVDLLTVRFPFQLIQGTTTDRDQQLKDQAAMIENLTGKVESYEENVSALSEKLMQSESKLKAETESFALKLQVKMLSILPIFHDQ